MGIAATYNLPFQLQLNTIDKVKQMFSYTCKSSSSTDLQFYLTVAGHWLLFCGTVYCLCKIYPKDFRENNHPIVEFEQEGQQREVSRFRRENQQAFQRAQALQANLDSPFDSSDDEDDILSNDCVLKHLTCGIGFTFPKDPVLDPTNGVTIYERKRIEKFLSKVFKNRETGEIITNKTSPVTFKPIVDPKNWTAELVYFMLYKSLSMETKNEQNATNSSLQKESRTGGFKRRQNLEPDCQSVWGAPHTGQQVEKRTVGWS